LVAGRKAGRERLLTLSPLPIKRIHDRWIGEYARAAVDLLARLDDAAKDAARDQKGAGSSTVKTGSDRSGSTR
ncbi:MAG TPA: hypothetical protein VJR25_01790, partial [Microbacterium sp.]|nr:hypothetical protein [Microbacterium sp.]